MTQFPPPQPVYPQPPMSPYPSMPPTVRTSGLAVAGFVCSLILCIPGLGVIGAILSFAGLFSTGPSGKRGRGLAIAGLIVGLLATGMWVAGGVVAYRVGGAVMEELKNGTNQFVDDYNRGDDRAIYDRLIGAKAGDQYAEFHTQLDAVRSRYGNAERIDSVWSMFSNGARANVVNDEARADFALKFEKAGQQRIHARLHNDGTHWRLEMLRIGEVKVFGDNGGQLED